MLSWNSKALCTACLMGGLKAPVWPCSSLSPGKEGASEPTIFAALLVPAVFETYQCRIDSYHYIAPKSWSITEIPLDVTELGRALKQFAVLSDIWADALILYLYLCCPTLACLSKSPRSTSAGEAHVLRDGGQFISYRLRLSPQECPHNTQKM